MPGAGVDSGLGGIAGTLRPRRPFGIGCFPTFGPALTLPLAALAQEFWRGATTRRALAGGSLPAALGRSDAYPDGALTRWPGPAFVAHHVYI